MSWDVLPTAFAENPSWLRDVCVRMVGSWDIPIMDCELVKSKWLTRGNLEDMPHKSNSNCHEGTTQGLSLWVYRVSVHTYCTLFLPNQYFTCITTFHLCWIFVCKAKGPGPFSVTTDLVVRIWYSQHQDPASISGWEAKLWSKPLQAKANWDQKQTALGFGPHLFHLTAMWSVQIIVSSSIKSKWW